jgi:2-keto-3-deoxy-L-rhamnonate aldolase RhmA
MSHPIQEFRRRLHTGPLLIGGGISFSDPLVTDCLADIFDFIWVDLEHNPLDGDALAGHLLAGRGRNKPVLVRTAGSSTGFIKPVLDAGADGIVVPQVVSVDEVRSVVADCRFRPLGRRGFGPRIPGDYGRRSVADVVRFANQDLFVSVMIETAEALEQIEEIVAVPGLDAIMIGPMDLSGAIARLGEVEDNMCIAAQERIISATLRAGLSVGAGMGANAEYARCLIQRGVQWLQVGSDYEYLIHYANLMRNNILGEKEQTGNA